jgi:hypothetical protein
MIMYHKIPMKKAENYMTILTFDVSQMSIVVFGSLLLAGINSTLCVKQRDSKKKGKFGSLS